MGQVHILHNGVEKDVDESELVRKDIHEENDNEIVEAVEYRFPGSDVIVHRSAHVTLKKWPDGLSAIAAEFK